MQIMQIKVDKSLVIQNVQIAHHLLQKGQNRRSRRYFPTVYYTAITAKDGEEEASRGGKSHLPEATTCVVTTT